MRVGLTLGKYAPLHAGHQHVIETALAEVDHLIVAIYPAPSHTTVPLSVRAGWIRELYPQAEVIEAHDGPEETGCTDGIIELQNRFLQNLLGRRKVDAFYSSEPYGEHVSRALRCGNRLVDPGRRAHPVSGTAIREAFATLPAAPAPDRSPLDALHPAVRADLIPRIVLAGGPSTGKTTTALALAERSGEPICLEYGREYWFAHQEHHRLSMKDLETIAAEQVRREREAAMRAHRYVVADTSPLTTLAYARYYFGEASALLQEIVLTYHTRDRFLVLCDRDIPFDDSWDRSGPGSREKLQEINLDELTARALPYLLVRGTTEERVNTILNALAAWRYRC